MTIKTFYTFTSLIRKRELFVTVTEDGGTLGDHQMIMMVMEMMVVTVMIVMLVMVSMAASWISARHKFC